MFDRVIYILIGTEGWRSIYLKCSNKGVALMAFISMIKVTLKILQQHMKFVLNPLIPGGNKTSYVFSI